MSETVPDVFTDPDGPLRDPEAPIDLGRLDTVWLQGTPVAIERTGAERAVARISANPGHLLVGGRRKRDALAAIDRWYRREARDRIEAVVAAESARLGLYPTKISVRNQRSRWGSCSTSGTLSFNWRLVIGDPEALRYVIVHELVHIRHHNHSRAFWSALTAAMPDWKLQAAWLRANERALLAWTPKI